MRLYYKFIVLSLIIFIAAVILTGKNKEDMRYSTHFQTIFEGNKIKELDKNRSPQNTNFHSSPVQSKSYYPDKKIIKDEISPGIRMARYEENVADLKARGTSPEKIQQILKNTLSTTGTGSISGSVYQSDEISLIEEYCEIRVYDEYGYYIGEDYCSGGMDSTYHIDGLSSGAYYVQITSNYIIRKYYDNVTDWREATLVDVIDGQEISGIDFYLEKSKVITGHIYEEDGIVAISNTEVRFYLFNAAWSSQYNYYDYDYDYYITTSNDYGEFCISSGINYPEIKIYAHVFGKTIEFYENADTWDNATVILTTGESDTIPDINFSLAPFLAEQDGYEQNNMPEDAYEISYGDTVRPQINSIGDIDYFKFYGLEGNTITIDIDAKNIGSRLDSYLYLIDSTGSYVLTSNDDYDDLDSRINSYTLPYSGKYYLKIRDYSNGGGENYTYSLTITEGEAVCIGTISGYIYEPDGVTPYTDNGRVYIYDSIEEDQIKNTSIYGNDSGFYSISGLNGGDYKIIFEPYNDLYSNQWYNGADNWEDADIVTVVPSDTTENINFILEIGSTITGRIYLPDGLTPYTGDGYINVVCDTNEYYFYEGLDIYINGNDSGFYSISGLNGGDYKIIFEPYNDLYSNQWYNGADNWEDADIVTVVPSDTTENINFILEIGSTITGRIYLPDGLTPYTGDGYINVVCDTNEYYFYEGLDIYINGNDSGFYSISGLNGGDYKISLNYYNGNYLRQWYDGIQNWEDATVVSVNNSDTTQNINFIAKQGGSIRGFVYSEDGSRRISDDSLEVEILFYNSLTGKLIDDAGISFAGGYKQQLWPGSYKIATSGFFNNIFPLYYGGGITYNDPRTSVITIAEGETKDLDLNISSGEGQLSGLVYDRNNNLFIPEDEAYVILVDLSGHFVQVTMVGIDYQTEEYIEDGKYTFSGLKAGTYYVMLFVDDYWDEDCSEDGHDIEECEGYHEEVIYWYGSNVAYEFLDEGEFFAANVPSVAVPIIVNEPGETTNINFHLNSDYVGIDDAINGLPDNYVLNQNYPNPFNPITHIQYGLPEQSDVTVIIYNIVGRKIKEFQLSNQKAGWHEIVWNGTNDHQQKVSTGIYIYQMRALRQSSGQAPDFIQTKKMVFMK